MLYTRQGFPEEEELVLCTVTKIFPHSVFVRMDEFGRDAMIHISEVSPGRIRNIRDFVVEGKKVVCKVLRIDKEKGHVDLSLRRVNEREKREKLDDIKKEQKSEKIVDLVAHKLKKELKSFYGDISSKVFKDYLNLHTCFEEVSLGKVNLEELGIEKTLAKELTENILQKIKPPEVEIKGDLKIISYKSDGIEIIKKVLAPFINDTITIKYEGAGKYHVIVKSDDYKSAEKILKKVVDDTIYTLEKNEGHAEFIRAE